MIMPQFVVPLEGVVVREVPTLSTSIEPGGKLRFLKSAVLLGCKVRFVANVRAEGLPSSL
jgi:hypothetical protein